MSLDIDNLIERLLKEGKEIPPLESDALKAPIKVKIEENELRQLTMQARELFLNQPVLLEVSAPMVVCGDIHGQFYDLLRIFHICGHPDTTNYLFLGDYVDRGAYSIEVIALLFCFKLKYPDRFFLLRGNHETASINRIYGFYDECKRRYTIKLWKHFSDCFNCLPLAAVIDGRIFCCHGGLSPDLHDLQQINKVMRPTDVPDAGVICDILWSDPDKDTDEWAENERGVSYVFGRKVVHQFLEKHKLDLVCRAHQVMEDGYEFFADRKLITIFSAPNYCGDWDNAGACLCVSKELVCSLRILKPVKKVKG